MTITSASWLIPATITLGLVMWVLWVLWRCPGEQPIDGIDPLAIRVGFALLVNGAVWLGWLIFQGVLA